jgi:hypothetical protein
MDSLALINKRNVVVLSEYSSPHLQLKLFLSLTREQSLLHNDMIISQTLEKYKNKKYLQIIKRNNIQWQIAVKIFVYLVKVEVLRTVAAGQKLERKAHGYAVVRKLADGVGVVKEEVKRRKDRVDTDACVRGDRVCEDDNRPSVYM